MCILTCIAECLSVRIHFPIFLPLFLCLLTPFKSSPHLTSLQSYPLQLPAGGREQGRKVQVGRYTWRIRSYGKRPQGKYAVHVRTHKYTQYHTSTQTHMLAITSWRNPFFLHFILLFLSFALFFVLLFPLPISSASCRSSSACTLTRKRIKR